MRDMLAGLPVRHSRRRRESSPVFVAAFLPVILAEGGNPECGLGLDSRGGHENDGGERPMRERVRGLGLVGGGQVGREGGPPPSAIE